MWDKRHGVLLFLNSFATGLLSPLLTLLLLGSGIGMAAVPLTVGLYSATTVVFEIPSGMAADRWGRKNCFLLSCVFLLPSLGLLALGRGLPAMLAAMVFLGLARAFSSGSLDALVVEEFLLKHGEEALPRCTARISALTSIGLAAGCLAGGGVYSLTGRLWAAIALKAAVVLALLALGAGLTEHPVARETANPVALLTATLRGSGTVRALVLLCAAAAPPVFAVEVFYQPRFTQLLHGGAAGWALAFSAQGATTPQRRGLCWRPASAGPPCAGCWLSPASREPGWPAWRPPARRCCLSRRILPSTPFSAERTVSPAPC